MACPVSVLIPAYNAQATLVETLQSVARQSFRDLEAFVVDDGSRDETARIAADFAATDARFRVVRQENAGAAAARNAALALARGEWIAPLDADDLWHPDKLARQLDRLKTAPPTTVLVYSWSVDIDEYSRVTCRRLDLHRFEGDTYAPLVLTNFIDNGSAPLIRRDALVAVGGWDVSLRARGAQGCEDWHLYLRLAEVGDFVLAPGFLIGYRRTPGSMSRSQLPELMRSYELVMAEARARHPELPARLFRWSRAAFEYYRFEVLRDSAPLSRFGALLSSISGDPHFLRRRSTRKKLKRWLASPFDGIRGRKIDGLQAFDEASPEPPYEVDEGEYFQARRRSVSLLRSNRRML